MGDWGVSKGLAALYGESGKRQSSKDELAILSMIDNKRKADDQEDKLARQEQEAYFDKVSEFSASLLAPDREKINQKARILSKKIRENVQMYGGDMSKFMANGGGQVMRDYKSSLLNSDEASLAASNKKNMDMIVKAQMSGQGGQINPTDLQNLQSYNKNRGGKVTFTGLLTAIDMPNAKAYDYGSDIPAEDILMNESNYTKIYGNYVTTFPNLPAPNKTDLINYVRNNYSGKGENWQRTNSARTAANTKAKAGLKNYDSNAYHISGDIVNSMIQFPEGLTAKEFGADFYSEGSAQAKNIQNISHDDYTDFARDYALEEQGAFDIGRAGSRTMTAFAAYPIGFIPSFTDMMENWIAEEYSVRNAKKVYNGSELQFAAASMNAKVDNERFNHIDNTITGWMPNGDSYTAAGVRVGDLTDPLDNEAYKGTWKVDAIILAGEGEAANNERTGQMIMNVVDSGKTDQEKTDKWNAVVMRDSEISMNTFMVMKNDKGDVFYQKVNLNDPGVASNINTQMGEFDNYSSSILNNKIVQKNRIISDQIAQKQSEPINLFYDEILADEQMNVNINSELLNYSPDGNFNDTRKNLLTSFYTSLGSLSKGSALTTFATESSVSKFTTMMQKASDEAGLDYISILKDQKTDDINIISMMLKNDPDQAQFYNLWMANHQILSKR